MADQRCALKMLFSCKIHIKTSPVSLLSSALPSVFFSLPLLCLHACDILYQRALVEMKLSFTPSAFAFFLLNSGHRMTMLCSRNKALDGVLLLEHHKCTFHLSSTLLALVQLQRQTCLVCPCVLMCATKVKRKSFKYPTVFPQLFSLFDVLEPSFWWQKYYQHLFTNGCIGI